ncbi:ankyrin repeat-containing protein [Planoprotostelium fungivorum]|uniref:Ankyrin repeat-containing protein n=1 Tax=Planoprotostelium fungivorum TaxID=1890364 RepID=A0A2P6N892_9EUKA|nr:ankyrin repeat-containing protein [Planoprotostelium fungivorum]PRP83301.1 ankyrin repeat-containing protein [Planoprotostelium fungivorum]
MIQTDDVAVSSLQTANLSRKDVSVNDKETLFVQKVSEYDAIETLLLCYCIVEGFIFCSSQLSNTSLYVQLGHIKEPARRTHEHQNPCRISLFASTLLSRHPIIPQPSAKTTPTTTPTITRRMDQQNVSLFLEAARTNNPKRVESFLRSGIPIDVRDEVNGSTALHYACLKGHRQTIEILVQNGANVNVRNNRGVTPLFYLVECRYDVMAVYLIHQGASLPVCDRGIEMSVLDIAPNFLRQELKDAAASYSTKRLREKMRRSRTEMGIALRTQI